MSKFKVDEKVWLIPTNEYGKITKISLGYTVNNRIYGECELHATAHTMLTEIGFEREISNTDWVSYSRDITQNDWYDDYMNNKDWIQYIETKQGILYSINLIRTSPKVIAVLTQMMREQPQ